MAVQSATVASGVLHPLRKSMIVVAFVYSLRPESLYLNQCYLEAQFMRLFIVNSY